MNDSRGRLKSLYAPPPLSVSVEKWLNVSTDRDRFARVRVAVSVCVVLTTRDIVDQP